MSDKRTYNKNYYETHKAQCLRNVKNYQSKLVGIHIRLKPAVCDQYKAAAAAAGMSLRGFILEAIDEKIEKSKNKPSTT